MRNLGPEWIAAIALSIQALIFAVQAGFFYWQARILRRHATTLEKNTEIMGKQAETLKLIGQALDQQGTILAEQTKIMDEQLKFQRKVDAKAERENVFRLAVTAQASLSELESRLGRLQMSVLTEADQNDVAQLFDMLARAVYECQTAALLSIHLLPAQKKNFIRYCDDLATLNRTGRMVEDFQNVKALRAKHADLIFCMTLGSLVDVPESSA